MINLLTVEPLSRWYDSKIFSVVIGALITLITFALSQLILHYREKNKDKKNLVMIITQSNSLLFSIIYQGSINKDKIDYKNLRIELEKSNVIFILNGDLRSSFEKLYKIHNASPECYTENKTKIHSILVDITNEISKYGDEVFGD